MRWDYLRSCRPLALAGTLLLTLMGSTMTANAAAPAAPGAMSAQIVQLVNQDRTSNGLNSLTVDPRLVAVAQQRAQYLIDRGFFSHCSGGEANTSCPQSGLDMMPRMEQAGIGVMVPGTTIAENLALNNYLAANVGDAASSTNTAWLNSPEHRANIMDAKLRYTGVYVECCWAGTIGGTTITASDQASVYVQVFSGGPGAVPPASPTTTFGTRATSPGCQFVLGFATMAATIPQAVGQCTGDESHNPVNGDALQHTSGGLLVWRKADNWTAFTDGYHTWVNGPSGVQERLNTQRFRFEANPDGLPVAA
jgi:uncharacterized protein YkwD